MDNNLLSYIEHVEAGLYADICYIKQELDRQKDTIGKRAWSDVQWFLGRVNEHQDGLERALDNIKKKLEEKNAT